MSEKADTTALALATGFAVGDWVGYGDNVGVVVSVGDLPDRNKHWLGYETLGYDGPFVMVQWDHVEDGHPIPYFPHELKLLPKPGSEEYERLRAKARRVR